MTNATPFRTEGRFSILRPTRLGTKGVRATRIGTKGDVYPVYLTGDLETLEGPRAIAAIYVPTSGEVGDKLVLVTLDWSTEAETIGELIEALEAHIAEGME